MTAISPGFPFFVHDMNKGVSGHRSLPEYWFIMGQGVQDFADWNGRFEIINSAPKAQDFPIDKRLQIVDLCRRQNLFMDRYFR